MSKASIIDTLISYHNEYRKSKQKADDARACLTEYAINYTDVQRRMEADKSRIHKLERNIEYIWGKEALEEAKKAVEKATKDD